MKRLGFDIVLLGDPASGKDTQSKLLMGKYFLQPVESGKYWRQMLKSKTADGAWVRRTMGLGHPAPVVLMKKFLVRQLAHTPKNKDLIFIGNPRLKPEAQLLHKLETEQKRNFFVLYLKLPPKEIYARALSRKTQEADDRKATKIRIDWHKHQVKKTADYFQKMKKLKYIDGNQSINKVAKDIEKAIHDYQRS